MTFALCVNHYLPLIKQHLVFTGCSSYYLSGDLITNLLVKWLQCFDTVGWAAGRASGL